MEKWERDAFDLYYQARKERERKRLFGMLLQKFYGIVLLGISAATVVLLQDLTVSVILVPVGVVLLFTRERVVR